MRLGFRAVVDFSCFVWLTTAGSVTASKSRNPCSVFWSCHHRLKIDTKPPDWQMTSCTLQTKKTVQLLTRLRSIWTRDFSRGIKTAHTHSTWSVGQRASNVISRWLQDQLQIATTKLHHRRQTNFACDFKHQNCAVSAEDADKRVMRLCRRLLGSPSCCALKTRKSASAKHVVCAKVPRPNPGESCGPEEKGRGSQAAGAMATALKTRETTCGGQTATTGHRTWMCAPTSRS